MSERLQQVIDHPLHQHLGLRDVVCANGGARLSVSADERTANPAGVFHGGVLYLLCDVCAYAGLLGVLDEAEEAVTHDIHVSVMRAAQRGDSVDFESTVVKRGRSLCFIDVSASVAGRRIAAARVTKSILASR